MAHVDCLLILRLRNTLTYLLTYLYHKTKYGFSIESKTGLANRLRTAVHENDYGHRHISDQNVRPVVLTIIIIILCKLLACFAVTTHQ